jgi:predicted kinase
VDAVIIDNTNVSPRECEPYVLFAQANGYEVKFLEPETPWAFDLDELEKKNTHGVPRHALERMLARWVPDMTVEKVLKKTVIPGAAHEDEKAAVKAQKEAA